MEPLVKEYLRTHSFAQLEEEHGVKARGSASHDKYGLNYDQIMTKPGDLVAEQCRGLVIRPNVALHADTWKDVIVGDVEILAWPMNRFYNHGDIHGADVNWNDPELRVYEKLDGTMIVVYWDNLQHKWHAGTRGVPEADLPIRKDHMEIGDATFSDIFRRALIETREQSTGVLCHLLSPMDDLDKIVHLNKEYTYVFELTSQFNRVVVKYDEPRVTLLAVRHTASGKEVAVETLNLQHVQRPKSWKLKSAASLEAFVNAANPAELEGAVVVDGAFRRLKVKNKAWVLSSKAKDLVTVSRRSALLAIIKGEIDDVLPLVEKDIADELTKMQDALRTYLLKIDKNFKDFKEISGTDRKTFALHVLETQDWTPAYFNMWEGRSTSALEYTKTVADAGKLSDSSLDTVLGKLKL